MFLLLTFDDWKVDKLMLKRKRNLELSFYWIILHQLFQSKLLLNANMYVLYVFLNKSIMITCTFNKQYDLNSVTANEVQYNFDGLSYVT